MQALALVHSAALLIGEDLLQLELQSSALLIEDGQKSAQKSPLRSPGAQHVRSAPIVDTSFLSAVAFSVRSLLWSPKSSVFRFLDGGFLELQNAKRKKYFFLD
mmetsp:Transcript_26719/g.46308  ORF Transcript_26719/g.46308 Transcript_26719/m.46308 type:complete len:103 (-) Transcript_26719:952-1260(-)